MHDVGRIYAQNQLGDAISTTYIDGVPENDWGMAADRRPNSRWNNYGDSALGKSELKSRRDTMRYWVNSQLSSNSPVYNAMMGVMNNNATLFGEQLISVTMRTDILTEIERSLGVDRFGELKIGFALVTGIGSGSKLSEQQIRNKQSLLNVPTGSAIDI